MKLFSKISYAFLNPYITPKITATVRGAFFISNPLMLEIPSPIKPYFLGMKNGTLSDTIKYFYDYAKDTLNSKTPFTDSKDSLKAWLKKSFYRGENKMNNKTRIIFLYLYVIITNVMLAQTYDEINNGIKSALEQKYGSSAYVGCFVNIDKEKNKYHEWNLEFKDPYGTLQNCYLFTANVATGGVVGVYKNNNLLWDSSPIVDLSNNDTGGHGIIGTIELNNKNNVEILANWNYGISGVIQNVWIFSWDGSIGKIINDTISGDDQNTYQSVIWSFSYITDVLDVDGDGIFEFKGVDGEHTSKTKIYSWNGEKYGDFGLTMPEYVPMNLLTVKVKCKVSKSQYGFLYNYTVKNDSTSKQSVVRFSVEKPYESVYVGSASPNNKWLNYYSSNWDYIYNWDVNNDFHKYPYDYMLPGTSRSGFKLETVTPIIYIGNYYIQGENGLEIADDDYLFENSFKGKTICGKNPHEPFVVVDFLDTLTTYTNSSYSLGWISNEQTRDKYNNYFNTTKNYLKQGGSSAARAELEKVLTDCNKDSSTPLTSEAYALLYFNTEYLVNKLHKVCK